MIQYDTPVEKYNVSGRTIYVKREDLCAKPPLPPLAKMRGIYQHLLKAQKYGVKRVATFDTRVSMAGYGVGIIARELGMECTAYYANQKELTPNLLAAQRVCTAIQPVYPGRTPICYVYAKRDSSSKSIYLVPQGLSCQETTEAVALEAKTLPRKFFKGSGTLVVSTGTGTILSGIVKGLDQMPAKLIGVSSCISPAKQHATIFKLATAEDFSLGKTQANILALRLLPPVMDYYDECNIDVPFDCNRHYDRKAWWWMLQNLSTLPDPILFWNIGGTYEHIFKENK